MLHVHTVHRFHAEKFSKNDSRFSIKLQIPLTGFSQKIHIHFFFKKTHAKACRKSTKTNIQSFAKRISFFEIQKTCKNQKSQKTTSPAGMMFSVVGERYTF